MNIWEMLRKKLRPENVPPDINAMPKPMQTAPAWRQTAHKQGWTPEYTARRISVLPGTQRQAGRLTRTAQRAQPRGAPAISPITASGLSQSLVGLPPGGAVEEAAGRAKIAASQYNAAASAAKVPFVEPRETAAFGEEEAVRQRAAAGEERAAERERQTLSSDVGRAQAEVQQIELANQETEKNLATGLYGRESQYVETLLAQSKQATATAVAAYAAGDKQAGDNNVNVARKINEQLAGVLGPALSEGQAGAPPVAEALPQAGGAPPVAGLSPQAGGPYAPFVRSGPSAFVEEAEAMQPAIEAIMVNSRLANYRDLETPSLEQIELIADAIQSALTMIPENDPDGKIKELLIAQIKAQSWYDDAMGYIKEMDPAGRLSRGIKAGWRGLLPPIFNLGFLLKEHNVRSKARAAERLTGLTE